MKIVLIGMSGSGKSTLAREIESLTNYPTLHLDKVWHGMDYSDQARVDFRAVQEKFVKEHDNWIIDGNYKGSLEIRLPEADLIVWLKISRIEAIFRVIKRSIKTRFFGQNRSDMASQFQEKFDKEYWEFLKFIWNFPRTDFPVMDHLIKNLGKEKQLFILRNKKDKVQFLSDLAAKK